MSKEKFREKLAKKRKRGGEKAETVTEQESQGSRTEVGEIPRSISKSERAEIMRLYELADSFEDSETRAELISKANDLLDGVIGTSTGGGAGSCYRYDDQTLRDNRDGTVTHDETGLVWLKDADAFGPVTWDQARSLVSKLHTGFGDLNDGSRPGDWRLPTIRELFSIVDHGREAPVVDDNLFPNVKAAIYWTSTTLLADEAQAWMMTLGIGPTVFMLKSTKHFMWPVRELREGTSRVPKTGQVQTFGSDTLGQDGAAENRYGAEWPSDRFDDLKDGTVRDKMTGLTWLKNADLFGWKTWEEAKSVCHQLKDGTYHTPSGEEFLLKDGSCVGDWRLPSLREAESLVDYGRIGPSIPDGAKAVFHDVRPSSYWTSTLVRSAPSQAYFIIYGVGPTIFENTEHPFFVWPVKGEMKG